MIVTPGKNGMSGHHVPNPSGAEAIVSDASLRFGSLSVRCGCHTETRYANSPHLNDCNPMTETHNLKDKTVNLAYSRGHQVRSWRAGVLQSLSPTCLNTPAWKFEVYLVRP